MQTIRVLIVDDLPHVRKGLEAFLSTYERIEIAGVAANGIEAIAQVKQGQPHVVLLDASMPHLDGFETAKMIQALNPAVHIILMDTKGDQQFLSQVRARGLHAYLLKNRPDTNLVDLIERGINPKSISLGETE